MDTMEQGEREPSLRTSTAEPAGDGEAQQFVSVLGGLTIGLYGVAQSLRQRPWQGMGLIMLGGLLMARGIVGRDAVPAPGSRRQERRRRPTRGWDEDSGRVRLERSTRVARPREDVYAFWRDVTNWPRVMPHLQSISVTSRDRFHWSFMGPTGATVMWDAALTEDRPNERIAWQSLAETGANNQGSVQFRSLGPSETEVTLTIEYSPDGGPVGAVTDRALGNRPEHRLDEQLLAFKRLMETPQAGAA